MPQEALPPELVEEVLLRLPPGEPAFLVRAALVSKRWCRLVSCPHFRRRFREFHRGVAPMLGVTSGLGDGGVVRFVPAATCLPRADQRDWHALVAHDGRKLLCRSCPRLVVWDPTRDERRELPVPRQPYWAAYAATQL